MLLFTHDLALATIAQEVNKYLSLVLRHGLGGGGGGGGGCL